MSTGEAPDDRFQRFVAIHWRIHHQWKSRPEGTLGVGLAVKSFSMAYLVIAIGSAILGIGKLKLLIGRFRIVLLRRRIASLEAKLRRDPYTAPRVGQALVCFFTPAKHRETAVLEMQIGYEYNVDRIGLSAARLAYWWELMRNTYAFCGGTKLAIGASALAVTATSLRLLIG
ncbi:hypothetical protein [Brevundimonas sp.]|uniref:hypothetical protein n=1 Tax=Brevundimonas sp. TaxID=1871086 RepID=UPI003F7018A3